MTRACAFLFAAFVCGAAQAQDPGALRARHAALHEHLAKNPFGRPLHVESTVSRSRQEGQIYAVVEQPFGVLAPALARPEHWCDVLTLQVNIKACRASADTLSAAITRKPRDPVDSAHPIDFRVAVAATRNDYIHVALSARSGPVGTRDYEIRFEAAPLDARRTFMHMSYAYTLGSMARFAMDTYLAGAGRDKFGFTVVERQADGRPVYVDGMRGVVERSAMRHYLGIEAYVESLATPPGQRLEKRLRSWYAAIARYPQLREDLGVEQYVEMKRKEAT